jgi:uncharacterized protein YdhG (YjbR/CyaY superfamily)
MKYGDKLKERLNELRAWIKTIKDTEVDLMKYNPAPGNKDLRNAVFRGKNGF